MKNEMLKKTFARSAKVAPFGRVNKVASLWLGLLGLLIFAVIATAVFAQNNDSSGETVVQALFGNSYKAAKTVPKRIFAQALSQFLELPPAEDEKCFKDLKKGDGANASICALKKAKVFTGSKKTKFKPKTKVTWKFAVTSLCRAGKWTKSKTWKSCLKHLTENNFLASPLPAKPSQKKKITYAELSVLWARSLTRGSGTPSGAPSEPPQPAEPPPAEIPAREIPELTFTPFPEKTIQTNFFRGILLAAPLPNTFYLDEVYFLEGLFAGQTAEEVFIFLCHAEETSCENSIDFIEETTDAGTKFKIPLHFKELGNFRIGVIPGRAGQSNVENISVLPSPTESGSGAAATDLSVKYDLGKTTFSWNGSATFARLTIFQDDKRKDYIFRQNTALFSPKSEDFAAFKKGPAFWLVALDGTESEKQSMKLTVQDFRKIETAEIKVTQLQEVFSGAPAQLTFQAESLAPISKKAAITLPSGQVKEINFAENDLSAGKNFKIEEVLVTPGTYIFEVNNPQGSAVVNVPIFVGTDIPLIPDYFALSKAELDTTPIANLDGARQKLLAFINADRKNNQLLPVVLINDINAIAQGHSNNMVSQNFFGHVDPSGLSPEDRRKKVKYPASIRENLAKAADLEGVEQGLMRSPVHRAAITDPEMTRVGLGITKNAEGYFIVTQNFSADPVFKSDLPGIEDTLFSKAAEKRTADSLLSIAHKTELREVAREWSAKMQEEGFFGLSDNGGNSLVNFARSRGIKSSLQVHIVKVSEKDQLAEELLKQTGLSDGENRNMGIGLAVSEIGELFMTVIYTP